MSAAFCVLVKPGLFNHGMKGHEKNLYDSEFEAVSQIPTSTAGWFSKRMHCSRLLPVGTVAFQITLEHSMGSIDKTDMTDPKCGDKLVLRTPLSEKETKLQTFATHADYFGVSRRALLGMLFYFSYQQEAILLVMPVQL